MQRSAAWGVPGLAMPLGVWDHPMQGVQATSAVQAQSLSDFFNVYMFLQRAKCSRDA